MLSSVLVGDEVSVFYDPMIAKLIVWAANRPLALRAMQKSLGDYQIAGVPTNLTFVNQLVGHPAFVAADLDINFIEKHSSTLFPAEPSPPSLTGVAVAALAILLHSAEVAVRCEPSVVSALSLCPKLQYPQSVTATGVGRQHQPPTLRNHHGMPAAAMLLAGGLEADSSRRWCWLKYIRWPNASSQ